MTTTLPTREPSLRPEPTPPPPIPFTRLLRVEWRKATDTRAARWLIGITLAATVLVMLAPVLAKNSIEQSWRTYLDFPALALTVLLPVVAILTLTGEWSQRTALTTFTQEPRRNRVIGAKVLVSVLMAVAAAGFGGLITVLAGWPVSAARHLEHNVGAAQALGFTLFILINMLMGVAFGALLHNTAAAVVLFFVVPTAFGLLGAAVSSLEKWIDPGTTFEWVLRGDWSGHAGPLAVSLALWIALPLAAGLVRTARREIK